MWMKKLVICGVAGVLLAGLSVAPVSAHGHHSQSDSAAKICSLCTLEGCTETGYHTHDGEAYCGYDHSCGYCDGSCGVVAVCTVEGCTKTGRHTHDDETYCGYNHTEGYCDNSCEKQRGCELSEQGCGRRHGHHSRHHR